MDNDRVRLDTTNYKTYIEDLESLQGELYDNVPLGNVIKSLAGLLSHYSVVCSDKFSDIKDSYQLMCDFMVKGFDDPHRADLYKQLMRRIFRLISDYRLEAKLKYDSAASLISTKTSNIPFDTDTLRSRLESFVTDITMLSLEPEAEKSQHAKELYSQRQNVLSKAFIDIIRSGQWSREQSSDMTSLLLSPTIDTVDAQTLCSAILMAALLNTDPYKVMALVKIYKEATDVRLRERALAGWVLAVNATEYYYGFFPDLNDNINSVLKDENACNEIVELQIQLLYCMDAERDTKKIQKDVMPTLLKNQNFEVTRFGIREKEDDPMDDILHSGDEMDKRMEEMEKTVQKMADMQKRGVDIYFGGFSKMKRFGFFYTLCNWFMPFFFEHPGLEHLSKTMLQSNFMKDLFEKGPFCESDKYSFALGMSSVYEKLPENIREMLSQGENFKIVGDSGMDVTNPAYIRRLYLQDLYRFFRINDSRKMFSDPFSKARGIFMTNLIFGDAETMHAPAQRLERFLIKRRQYKEAEKVLNIYYKDNDVEDQMMRAHVLASEHDYKGSGTLYDEVLKIDGNNQSALRGAASASFHCGDYDKAMKLYSRLSEIFPEKTYYQLNTAICLINGNKAEEGVNLLYEMYYKYPGNYDVLRALAWGLLSLKRLEQAMKYYKEIIESEGKVAADYLNAGYCAWFNGDIEEAVRLFKEYTDNSKDKDIVGKFRDDKEILDRYGIPKVNRLIVAGMVK